MRLANPKANNKRTTLHNTPNDCALAAEMKAGVSKCRTGGAKPDELVSERLDSKQSCPRRRHDPTAAVGQCRSYFPSRPCGQRGMSDKTDEPVSHRVEGGQARPQRMGEPTHGGIKWMGAETRLHQVDGSRRGAGSTPADGIAEDK